jgi:hypothetical protein
MELAGNHAAWQSKPRIGYSSDKVREAKFRDWWKPISSRYQAPGTWQIPSCINLQIKLVQ